MTKTTILPCLLFCTFLVPFSLSAQEFDDLNDQAYKERDSKNYRKAIDLCTRAIAKKINARSFIIRADCRYSLKEYSSAIEDFNSSLTYYYDYYGSASREKAGIYYFLGRSKQYLNMYSDAINDFNSALSHNYSETGYVYWNWGACYYNLGKYQEADEDYIKAIDRITDKNDLSTLWENRGDCQVKFNNNESAHSYYGKAIDYNPGNYSPFWQRGHFQSQQKKYDEALSDFNRAIELINRGGTGASSSDEAMLYRNIGLMHKYLNRNEDALKALNKSVEKDPNFAKAYRSRAEVYGDMKKYDRARSDYENAITLQADKLIRSDIYIDRSIMEKKVLDYRNCLSDLNKSIEVYPGGGLGFWHRSLVHGYKKNYADAIKDCNTAMEFYRGDSSRSASLLWLRAGYRDFSGDYAGALDDYRAYLKYYPSSYSAYYEMGRIYKFRLKNNDLAQANLSRAANLAEKNEDTVKNCYIKVIRGDKEAAIREMQEVVKTYRNDKESYYNELHNLCCIYSLAGNTVKAFESLDKSLAAGYEDYLHLVNDRDLASLMKLPQWKAILAKYKVPQPRL